MTTTKPTRQQVVEAIKADGYSAGPVAQRIADILVRAGIAEEPVINRRVKCNALVDRRSGAVRWVDKFPVPWAEKDRPAQAHGDDQGWEAEWWGENSPDRGRGKTPIEAIRSLIEVAQRAAADKP